MPLTAGQASGLGGEINVTAFLEWLTSRGLKLEGMCYQPMLPLQITMGMNTVG